MTEPAGDSCTRRVLVLNRNWQAVNIVGLRRAFSLLWQGHARAIHTLDGSYIPMDAGQWIELSSGLTPGPGREFVKTVRLSILMPKVLLLQSYDRMPAAEVKFNRENIFIRDNYTCQYTGRRYRAADLTLDHVIPRERGGRTSWENIVTCAREVNSQKANRLPHEAGLRLIRRPEKPRLRPFAVTVASQSQGVDQSWRDFLPV